MRRNPRALEPIATDLVRAPVNVSIASRWLIRAVRFYQWALSPLLGGQCRFEPTCSRYSMLCLAHHGAWRGSWLTLRRLLRCNPLFSGGIDLPPPTPGVDFDRAIDHNRLAKLYGCCAAEATSNPCKPLSAIGEADVPTNHAVNNAQRANGVHRRG